MQVVGATPLERDLSPSQATRWSTWAMHPMVCVLELNVAAILAILLTIELFLEELSVLMLVIQSSRSYFQFVERDSCNKEKLTEVG